MGPSSPSKPGDLATIKQSGNDEGREGGWVFMDFLILELFFFKRSRFLTKRSMRIREALMAIVENQTKLLFPQERKKGIVPLIF